MWTWFSGFLKKNLDISIRESWTIIFYQQKVLHLNLFYKFLIDIRLVNYNMLMHLITFKLEIVDAIINLMPVVEHKLCKRHVYANLINWRSGVNYREIL